MMLRASFGRYHLSCACLSSLTRSKWILSHPAPVARDVIVFRTPERLRVARKVRGSILWLSPSAVGVL